MKLRAYQRTLVEGVVSDLTPRPKKLVEVVLAACPGAGKTFMSIEAIGRLLASRAIRRVLVLAHGTKILRSQYAGELEDLAPAFSWATYLPGPRPGYLPIADMTVQLVVALPQSLAGQDVSGFDLIVVDEAHQFYGEKMVTDIIARSKAKRVLLLTGTPSPFVERGLPLHAVTMQEIFRAGREASDGPYIANARAVLLQSKYDVRRSQYNHDGEIKRAVRFSRNQTEETLADLLKWFPKAKTWGQAFAQTGKAMIVCRSQEIALQTREYFARAGAKAVLSASDTDDGSGIEDFKKDRTAQLLIVVCRANLGFNFPQLGALIDMTGTINIDRIFQMFARVVRPNGAAPKLFIKLASADMHAYTRARTAAAMQLQHRHVYLTWNGTNLNGIRIPLDESPPSAGGGASKSGVPRPLPRLDEGFLALGEFMQEQPHEDGSLRSWTTVGAVAEALGHKQYRANGEAKEGIRQYYSEHKRAIPPRHPLYWLQRHYTKKTTLGYDSALAAEIKAMRAFGQYGDVTGKVFGNLTVVKFLGHTGSGFQLGTVWSVRCVCGALRSISGMNVLRGGTCLACRQMKTAGAVTKLTKPVLSDIAARRARGQRLKEIAKDLGLSYGSIRRGAKSVCDSAVRQ